MQTKRNVFLRTPDEFKQRGTCEFVNLCKKAELIGPAQIHRFVKLLRSEEGKPRKVSCAALSSPIVFSLLGPELVSALSRNRNWQKDNSAQEEIGVKLESRI